MALECPWRLLLALALIIACTLAQQANRFKACKRAQPAAQLNKCVKESVQKAIPELKNGLPEYGMKPIDPLRIENLKFPKKKGPVDVDLTFKNLDVIGLSKLKITTVEVDVAKYWARATSQIDGQLQIFADYTVQGKVLVLPVEGKGPCNITLVNPKFSLNDLKAKPMTKNGKQYAQVTSFKLTLTSVDKVLYHFENLFNGNKELGDNMNLVLNDNWKVIFEDTKEPLVTAIQQALRHIPENLLSKVPYNKIFP